MANQSSNDQQRNIDRLLLGVPGSKRVPYQPPQDKKNKNKYNNEHEAGAHAFLRSFPWIRLGGIFKIAEGAQYTVTKPGDKVFIGEIVLDSRGKMVGQRPSVRCVSLNDEGRARNAGKMFEVAVDDLELIDRAEEESILQSWAKPLPEFDPFADGTPVQLNQDVHIIVETWAGQEMQRLPKGLAGVVDTPDEASGGHGDRGIQQMNKPKHTPPTWDLELCWRIIIPGVGEYKPDFGRMMIKIPQAGYGFEYKVYVPKYRGHIKVDRSQLDKRPFRKDFFDDVIMSDATRREILATVMGKQADLKRWGVEAKLTKGKGSILLGFGPPGGGKTITAEALADKLERVLYIVDSSVLGEELERFEQGLKEIIDRAKRWNAVVLWDECEVYMATRGNDTESNTRVTAILRHLEHFDGIMFLTTNRPVKLDHAISSRIHTRVFFPAFTPEDRRRVWEVTLPKELKTEDLDLNKLAEIPINGREIKNALLKACKWASFEGLDAVPAKYLYEAAEVVLKEERQLQDDNLMRDWAQRGAQEDTAPKAIEAPKKAIEAPKPNGQKPAVAATPVAPR